MNQIFGEFIEELPLGSNSLELSFVFSSQLINRQWRNIRLAAYFIADYLSNFLPVDENDSQQEELIKVSKDSVSYVSNELLENAIKFNEDRKHYPVKLGVHILEELEKVTAVIFTKNTISIQSSEKLQSLIQELLFADPHELYVQQIEKTAEDEHDDVSGLGLLTIINDYSAKLGWKFESESSEPDFIIVTTMAQVIV